MVKHCGGDREQRSLVQPPLLSRKVVSASRCARTSCARSLSPRTRIVSATFFRCSSCDASSLIAGAGAHVDIEDVLDRAEVLLDGARHVRMRPVLGAISPSRAAAI